MKRFPSGSVVSIKDAYILGSAVESAQREWVAGASELGKQICGDESKI